METGYWQMQRIARGLPLGVTEAQYRRLEQPEESPDHLHFLLESVVRLQAHPRPSPTGRARHAEESPVEASRVARATLALGATPPVRGGSARAPAPRPDCTVART
jgi:hypothetical protein